MTKGEADLNLRRARAMGHAAPPNTVAVPPPPYQLRDCSFLMVGTTFERTQIDALVPDELEIDDEPTGGFYMYTAPIGWGIAPYTATLAWVDVKGFDSADGSRARYMLYAGYSGTAFQALRYVRHMIEGYARLASEGNLVEGQGGPRDETHLRLRARLKGEPPIAADGTHYYIAPKHDGSLCIVPVAFSYDLTMADPMAVEILSASSPLAAMRPKALTWAGWLTKGVITIGKDSPIADRPGASATMASASYLNLLGQIGKAAVVIDGKSRILFQNAAAAELDGDGIHLRGGHFEVTDRAAKLWTTAIAGAATASLPWWQLDPVAIPRELAAMPLLAQIMPQAVQGAEVSFLLVVLTDPEKEAGRTPHRALQLLGLTMAEAKVAALVGSGLSPQEVAHTLGNTPSTIRSTLRQVYDKLGIGRQSELARLVARLGSLGL